MFIGISILIILAAAYVKYTQHHKENQPEIQKLEENLVSLQKTIHQTLIDCKSKSATQDATQNATQNATHQVN